MTTVLTWEPVRARLHAARITAATACAVVIGLLLELVSLLALLPSVFAHGTTAGVDGDWYVGLSLAVLRLSLLAGVATALGAALAFIARNTAGAIVAVWAWLAIVEGLVRVHRPGLSGYLLGDNVARVISWADLETGSIRRSPTAAAVTVLLYAGVLAVASGLHFRRVDIAAT